jgi:hypothetical protein
MNLVAQLFKINNLLIEFCCVLLSLLELPAKAGIVEVFVMGFTESSLPVPPGVFLGASAEDQIGNEESQLRIFEQPKVMLFANPRDSESKSL